MIHLLKKISATMPTKKTKKHSDFSDFFASPAREKKKVISEILREVNKEQRNMVESYRRRLP